MANLINKVRELDTRQILLLLHGVIAIVAFSGAVDFITHAPNNDAELRYRSYPMEFQVSSLSISWIISLLLLIVGGVCSSLHKESTMVVHSSLILWMIHLSDYSHSQILFPYYGNANMTVTEDIHANRIPSAMAVDLALIVLYMAQVALGSQLLRSQGSQWPRLNFMQFFTLDTLLMGVRFGFAMYLVGETRMYSFSSPSSLPPAIYYITNLASFLNLILVVENSVTLLWGVPHRKMLGVQSLLCSLTAVLAVLVAAAMPHAKDTRHGAYTSFFIWGSITTVLGAVYGILCLVAPTVLSTTPMALKMFRQNDNKATPEDIVTSRQRDGDNGEELSYGRLYSTNSSTDAATVQSEGTRQTSSAAGGTRMTVLQMLRTSRPFLRNIVYLCMAVLILSLEGSHLAIYESGRMYEMWPPRVIVCSTACLLLRCLPDIIAQLVTRTELPTQAPLQVAAAVMIEVILSFIGALGTFITVFRAFVAQAAAVAALVVVLLQCVQMNGMIRAFKGSRASV